MIIAGKHKGKKGKVLRVEPADNHIVVEKVNVVTKHVRKRQAQAGEIIKFEAPFSVSNAMVICPHCDKVTRVHYRLATDGKKQRICKKCDGLLDRALEVS